MKQAAFKTEQYAKLRFTNASGVLEHGPKYGLQIARRAGDDLQHLGGRGLLLQRLGELAPTCFELLFQIGAGLARPADGRTRLRSGGTNAATVRSALRAFARQGHLIGAGTRPMLVVTGRGSSLPVLKE